MGVGLVGLFVNVTGRYNELRACKKRQLTSDSRSPKNHTPNRTARHEPRENTGMCSINYQGTNSRISETKASRTLVIN